MALDAIVHRKRDSWWQRFQQAPCPSLARLMYAQRQQIIEHHLSSDTNLGITVVCISDTHNAQPRIPAGDVLIHAGDLTQKGTAEEIQAQLDWLKAQPHRHKVVIAGNHDVLLDREKAREFKMADADRENLRWGSLIYLDRSTTTIRLPAKEIGLSVFGDPRTRRHGNWAFQYEKGTDAFTHQVDSDADILITHSPPRFHLDVANWGDESLMQELWRIQPKLHVVGHIHAGHGRDMLMYDHFEYLYEQICAGRAGIVGLIHMLLILLFQAVVGLDRNSKRTILINASCVGGDLDQLCRDAQVVHL
jgi:predicted phosphohydrolase